jgi:transposase-like protein
MENHATSRKFSPEVRERAVRMVLDHRSEHPSQWAAIVIGLAQFAVLSL